MRLWTLSVCGLLGRCSSGTRTEFLTRRLAGPGTRIDIANDTQPLFGFGQCREVTHVQTEALAALFEAAAHEEGKALQLFLVGLSQCHRRGR